MNELNIYKKFKYRKLLKIANLYFTSKYKWFNAKTIFISQNDNYIVSLNKYNIRIYYYTNDFQKDKTYIENFLLKVLGNEETNIIYSGECDILDDFDFIKKIKIG